MSETKFWEEVYIKYAVDGILIVWFPIKIFVTICLIIILAPFALLGYIGEMITNIK